MNFKAFKILAVIIMLTILISTAPKTHANSLTLTVATDKSEYSMYEPIFVNGTLSLDGTPINDGLVTIQVNLPNGSLWLLRTCLTGTNVSQRWSMEITQIVPCDSGGNPKYSFQRGTYLGFKVTIKNNDLTSHAAKLFINTFYGSDVPFGIEIMWEGTVEGEQEITVTAWPVIYIPYSAELGTATAYALLVTGLPEEDGFAYCPESSIEFEITPAGTSSLEESQSPIGLEEYVEGSYNLTFRSPEMYAALGNYTIYTICFYWPQLVKNSTTFELILRGDLNGDKKCDIRDIAIVAAAYGSFPGDPNWDPRADVYPDGKIDIRDVALVAADYGKIAS